MSILGIDEITYGAADLDTCRRFFADWGLKLVQDANHRLVFESLNGCRVLVADPAHASLPAAIEDGPTLREVVWGVSDAETMSMLRERMMRNQAEYREANVNTEKFDENRFEQELFYFLEKLDITEEKVRLRKHCDYFGETLADPASGGRKMGFILQEIGREINTLGSKANDADIQKIVVQMKDELEKIKEQTLNIL